MVNFARSSSAKFIFWSDHTVNRISATSGVHVSGPPAGGAAAADLILEPFTLPRGFFAFGFGGSAVSVNCAGWTGSTVSGGSMTTGGRYQS